MAAPLPAGSQACRAHISSLSNSYSSQPSMPNNRYPVVLETLMRLPGFFGDTITITYADGSKLELQLNRDGDVLSSRVHDSATSQYFLSIAAQKQNEIQNAQLIGQSDAHAAPQSAASSSTSLMDIDPAKGKRTAEEYPEAPASKYKREANNPLLSALTAKEIFGLTPQQLKETYELEELSNPNNGAIFYFDSKSKQYLIIEGNKVVVIYKLKESLNDPGRFDKEKFIFLGNIIRTYPNGSVATGKMISNDNMSDGDEKSSISGKWDGIVHISSENQDVYEGCYDGYYRVGEGNYTINTPRIKVKAEYKGVMTKLLTEFDKIANVRISGYTARRLFNPSLSKEFLREDFFQKKLSIKDALLLFNPSCSVGKNKKQSLYVQKDLAKTGIHHFQFITENSGEIRVKSAVYTNGILTMLSTQDFELIKGLQISGRVACQFINPGLEIYLNSTFLDSTLSVHEAITVFKPFLDLIDEKRFFKKGFAKKVSDPLNYWVEPPPPFELQPPPYVPPAAASSSSQP